VRRAAAPLRQVLKRHSGLRRWAGQAEAYLQALTHFQRQYGALAGQLKVHTAARDWQGAQMLAHKARGVAANLGLESLAETLAQFEHACGDAAGQASLDSRQHGVAAALETALAAIGAPPEPVAAPAESVVSFDAARAARSGAALQASLGRGALDDAALAELCATLATHSAGALLAPVHAALADFDLVLAKHRVDAVLAKLGADPIPEPSA
jgi:HPt (histidine-containing phosphotransfer) domain-containing protein